MKIITASLSGAALDWAVAKCENIGRINICHAPSRILFIPKGKRSWYGFKPSESWKQGGPIIEREEIAVHPSNTTPHEWVANAHARIFIHKSPLIAAMRCYVASELGDEVEIPDELLQEGLTNAR